MEREYLWFRAPHQVRPKPAKGKVVSTARSGQVSGQAIAGIHPHPDPLTAWPPTRRTHLIAALAVAALALLAFANSLGNGFALDDVPIIRENPAIRNVSNLRAIFAAGYWPENKVLLYRPLVIFSYALNYAVAGLAPFSYHLVNVLLHAANSVLVYFLLLALFGAQGLALSAAAAFALHPIHTEAVANVVGRAELLASAFLFLSWRWYLKWDAAEARAKTGWLTASLAAFTLALFSKEHVVILPGLLVLSDLLLASERGLSPGRTILNRCRTVYPWYLPPVAAYLLARFAVLGKLQTPEFSWLAYPLVHADLWARYLTTIKALGRYLWLLLYPVPLTSDYSYNQVPVSHSLFEPAVLIALLALLVMFGFAVWSWRRRPVFSVGVAIFAVAVLPVSNLLFPIGTIMAERVLYLPSLGFCLVLAAAMTAMAARPRAALLAAGAFGLLLLGYGARTVIRNRDWRSNLTLFTAAARTSPNSTDAHAYLGDILLDRGDLSGAKREFERSLEIYPTYGKALAGLGVVLERQGQIDGASQVYHKIDKGNKYYGRARVNLGFLALRQGRSSDALTEFREAAGFGSLGAKESNELAEGFFQLGSLAEAQAVLEAARRSAPDVFYIRRNLALLYLRQERWEDGLREMEAAASLAPASPEIQRELGKLYAQRGLPAAAEAALRASLRLRPNDLETLLVLGTVLVQQSRLKDAEAILQTATALRPDHAEAQYALGVILAKKGKPLDAQRHFEMALRFRSQYPAAHRALGNVLQQQGRSAEARREFHVADQQERSRRP